MPTVATKAIDLAKVFRASFVPKTFVVFKAFFSVRSNNPCSAIVTQARPALMAPATTIVLPVA
ncbi:Uncharacterised protein [Vibrio cholerae]|uniref:Uncharacterized protein n=1 Tax=Vibrio cholerae TaxID=666 RepID=A0A655XAH7_VIBCL|nr:Uncharacterised protein [Vibrio cholerae]CSC07676.1 Uncharacterised protein [Vibrio cholerae]CSC61383.1 Uncharacterised protein [Vibrio cholerae]CSC64946.1 Uncharacterised protein [Vibrio cholerae]